MKIYKWKLSKLQVLKLSKVKVQGNLVAVTSDGNKYIPFGGIDSLYETAYKKAISELNERAAWFTMYSLHPSIVPNTTGFAAHTDKEKAIQSSIYEVIERKAFHYFIKLIMNNKIDEIYSNFHIQNKKDFLLFSKPYLTQAGELWITFAFDLGRKIIPVGMGKQNNLAESIDDAIDECIMVNHSIEKYLISHSNKQSTQSMSQEELFSFINLGKSTLLQDNLEKLSIENNYYENVKTKNIESLLTLNVTRYIPKFLSPTNRYVYLSVPLEKADAIKNNYRI